MNEYSELLEFAMSSAVSAPFFQPLEQNLPTVGIRLNALNRPVSLSSANSVDQFFYDLLGRATNRIDAASNPWKTEYDALSRPIKSIRPTGAEEQFSYDSRGNRTGFINAENKAMGFGFDAQGRVTSITNAIGKVTEYSHDLNGNIISRRDAEGAETLYNYDEMNRLIRVDSSNSWAGFDYDLNSNLTETSNQTSEVSFNYDSMNRRSSSTSFVSLVSFVVQNSFDLNGNRTNILYPGGLSVGYTYDEENRLSDLSISAPSAPLREISFSYDGASRLTNIVYPNGVSGDYVYDAESRILEYSYSNGSSNFLRHVLQRDPRGFKTIEDTYAGLLPSFTNEAHQTRTHNDADQLLSTGDTDYQYNANGCLTSSVTSAQSVDYSYDFDNRLTSANDVEYLYDASGARIGRIAGVSPAVTNYFVVDYTDPLKRPLAETDSNGTITRYYIWAGFQLLAHIEADGTTRYYHSDEIGSTLALTDETGTVTDQFAYSPYGQALGRTGSTETPFQWLGGYGVYYDSDTDLHLTLHRAYSAHQKRFISSDPMGIEGGVNLYAYGNLNPLAFVDPYGLCAESADESGFAYGFAYHGSTINPLTSRGGAVVGQNQMTFFESGETKDYVYGTADRGGLGLDVGVAMESVAAWGSGEWSGDFDSVNVNIGPFSASYFWSPGGDGWRGVTFGIGVGAPGIGYEGTTYYDMP